MFPGNVVDSGISSGQTSGGETYSASTRDFVYGSSSIRSACSHDCHSSSLRKIVLRSRPRTRRSCSCRRSHRQMFPPSFRWPISRLTLELRATHSNGRYRKAPTAVFLPIRYATAQTRIVFVSVRTNSAQTEVRTLPAEAGRKLQKIGLFSQFNCRRKNTEDRIHSMRLEFYLF